MAQLPFITISNYKTVNRRVYLYLLLIKYLWNMSHISHHNSLKNCVFVCVCVCVCVSVCAHAQMCRTVTTQV